MKELLGNSNGSYDSFSRRGVFVLFIMTLIYALSFNFVLLRCISMQYPIGFHLEFSIIKFVNSLIWCVVLFWGINHSEKKSSTFFLILTLLVQIVPLSSVYCMCGGNAVFYNLVCLSFLIVELFVGFIKIPIVKVQRNRNSNLFLAIISFFCISIVFTFIVTKNGLPPLTALNIYNVYKLRSSGSFKSNSIVEYLLSMIVTIIIPFYISKNIKNKKNFFVMILCLMVLILYLYTGRKVYLFSIPVNLVCSYFGDKNNFCLRIFQFFCLCMIVLSLLCVLNYQFNLDGFFVKVYSLLGRRTFLLPAKIKFCYMDYFLTHKKFGFYGLFPQWIIETSSTYDDSFNIGHVISNTYLSNDSNSSTGFLGEAVMRFGYVGIIVSLFLFSIILKLLDNFQIRNNYQITIGAFSFLIYSLNDAPLLSSIIAGPILFMNIILLLYSDNSHKNEGSIDYER